MKKIIIVNSNLHIGGVQKALVNLLKEIESSYDITLALFNPAGDLMKELPSNVKILSIDSGYRFLGLSKHDVATNIRLKIKRNVYACITRILGRDAAIQLMLLNQKKITGYDVAISYIHNGSDKSFYGGCNDFVLRHIDAQQKITFIHCDYGLSGANSLKNKEKYKMFDTIVTCSEGCNNSFLKEVPELKDKTKIVYNFQDYELIREKSEELNVRFDKNTINIVTVARLGKEKAVHRAIDALGQCCGKIDKYHYYVIGDGIERKIIEEKIQRYGLEKQVTLMGELKNPYPYIKAADLLLISSYSEAAPMVIGEAASLGTPILSTETSSAKELVGDAGVGWVCENSIVGIKDKLSLLINNKDLVKKKKKEINTKHFNNETAIKQFSALFQDKKAE